MGEYKNGIKVHVARISESMRKLLDEQKNSFRKSEGILLTDNEACDKLIERFVPLNIRNKLTE